jgi:hypothetical protein
MRRARLFAVHVCRLPAYVVIGIGLACWEWAAEWKREVRWL